MRDTAAAPDPRPACQQADAAHAQINRLAFKNATNSAENDDATNLPFAAVATATRWGMPIKNSRA